MDFGDGTMPKDREEKWDGGEKWVAGRNKRDGSRARAREAAPQDSTLIVLLYDSRTTTTHILHASGSSAYDTSLE